MVEFTTTIRQFGKQGEKTGWTYISIPADIAGQLKPNNRQSFRVKGKLDKHPIRSLSAMPMGDGTFILTLNADLRKAIHKGKGAMLKVQLTVDKSPLTVNAELLACLADDPEAEANFNKMPPSHQQYYSKWIDSAKTEPTRTKRITQCVIAMAKGMNYGEMIRSLKEQ
ncbi:MAG: YdeI/OmpD-associated family protein [Candidatus Pseudobacter hemicellulosilyticus]|uniref:YdeI/OmpD-associated family protein n=1 Tax=Candidatus Pseudobacter hemicellulosilyticus TaxID=3121375 RepID=A0AAJ5WTZ2_9BACT|nr:MAG: YdeI/OmpD-associated family protein [Pseudobacter sp.]